ncbi:uncharacterized protein LOC130426298 isoform X2 [Triplophysa dalaica]|uniref:uncharacterized protein LOC130426298 isoform X2 n=1 Tax=Triplophysa dalaica TaxID=1582913 RepID=UPI0024DF79F4|nr:uncharacterized protein LOC130426298 isoform X2 [Triplophysa dalaica]
MGRAALDRSRIWRCGSGAQEPSSCTTSWDHQREENGTGGKLLCAAVAGDGGEGHHHKDTEALQAVHSRQRESSPGPAPPEAAASSSGSKGVSVGADDVLLLEALASFEGEASGEAGRRKKDSGGKKKARSDPPQKPHTFPVRSSAAPASARGVEHGRTSNVTDADVRATCVVGPDVTCAALQPCLDTATPDTAGDTPRHEVAVSLGSCISS